MTHLHTFLKVASAGDKELALILGGTLGGAGLQQIVEGNSARNAIMDKLQDIRYQRAISDFDRKLDSLRAGEGDKVAAAGLQSPSALFRPKATPTPVVPMPGVGKTNSPASAPMKAPAAPAPGKTALSSDNSAMHYLAALGLGGAGGYMVGENILKPHYKALAEKAIVASKAAPVGGAMVGALLLAALVALMKRGGPAQQQMPPMKRYDPEGEQAGFDPRYRVPFRGMY
jgi:hypothetical protein